MKCIEDEIPFEIPAGWEWTKLRNIVFGHGQKIPSEKFSYIDIGSIDNKNQCLNTSENIIEPQNAPSRARRIVESGDILYSTVRPYLHNMCIVDKQFSYTPIASTGLAVLACHIGICNRFLFIYLQSPQFDLYANDGDNAKGVAYPAINDEKLYAAFVPVPPFSEQQRIISKIQNLNSPVDRYGKSQEVLDQLNSNISRLLKRSILQEAIQGKLVPQIAEEGTAGDLLAQIKAEKLKLVKEGKLKKSALADSVIFKGDDNRHYEQVGADVTCIEDEIPFEIPDSWSWVRLRDLCSIITGATFKKEDVKQCKNGVRVLRGGNIFPFEIKFKQDDIFLNASQVKTDILLKQNDLITPAVTSLENICKMARVVRDMDSTTVGGFVFILRLYRSNDTLSRWLLSVLSSPSLIEFVKSITNKSGQAFYNIGKERLGTTMIPLPPHKEQERIVQRINEVFSKL